MKERQLIKAILNGEAQEYAILVNRYQRPIFNLLLRMTHDRETAADLTQEAFLKAYENLDKFKLRERFFPWLYAIAANLARDRHRKQQHANNHAELIRQTAASTQEKVTAVEEHMADLVDARRLKRCMDQLPADYREALILRYHEGLAMGDIGKALGVTTSGAKMRISRGLQKLRSIFQSSPHSKCNNNPHIREDGSK